MAKQPTRTIELQVFLEKTPAKVFEWISSPKYLEKWFVDKAINVPKKGGEYAYGWTDGPSHTGKILEFVRGKRIVLSWQWPGLEDQLTTRLRLSVEPRDGGTVLKFRHAGFPKAEKWVELYGGAIHGWMYFMMNLKSVLDHGHDLRSGNDW